MHLLPLLLLPLKRFLLPHFYYLLGLLNDKHIDPNPQSMVVYLLEVAPSLFIFRVKITTLFCNCCCFSFFPVCWSMHIPDGWALLFFKCVWACSDTSDPDRSNHVTRTLLQFFKRGNEREDVLPSVVLCTADCYHPVVWETVQPPIFPSDQQQNVCSEIRPHFLSKNSYLSFTLSFPVIMSLSPISIYLFVILNQKDHV